MHYFTTIIDHLLGPCHMVVELPYLSRTKSVLRVDVSPVLKLLMLMLMLMTKGQLIRGGSLINSVFVISGSF